MITLTNYMPGMAEKCAAAGHALWQHDNQWVSSNDAAVQAIIDAYTASEALAFEVSRVCDAVDAHAAQLRIAASKKFSRHVTAEEIGGWGVKRPEALAFAASGNPADAPNLNDEATRRGVTLSALVTKVLQNSGALAPFESWVSGNAGRHRDAVKRLATWQEVAAYDWHTGWPA